MSIADEGPGAGAQQGGAAGALSTLFSQLKPPKSLNFMATDIAEGWTTWKEEFNLYLELALGEQTEKHNISLLKYLIGKEGREIYATFKILETEADTYTLKNVLKRFDEHCVAQRNEDVERYKFLTRRQGGEEAQDHFITDLKVMAGTCDFGALEDSLVKTMIIIGMNNSALRERLLRETKLTLKRCIEMCRATEATKENKNAIERAAQPTETVHKLNRRVKSNQKYTPVSTSQSSKPKYRQKPPIDCGYCGKRHEKDKHKCPAYGKQCQNCHKRNHFSAVCKAKDVHAVAESEEVTSSTSEENHDYEDIRKFEEVNRVEKGITANMILGGRHDGQREVPFEVDCGASCDIVPQHYLKNTKHKLEETRTILKMYDGNLVTPVGKVTMKVKNPKNDKKYLVAFEVVSDDKYVPILGRKTSQRMGLIEVNYDNIARIEKQQIDMQPLSIDQLLEEFPTVFEGTGKLTGKYHIETDKTVKPVIHPARRVPVAIKQQLKEELDYMVRREIVAPETDPTDWVSSMVVVKKPTGKLRICLDPKQLNQAIKRSHHQMTTIEEILPDLHQAKIFSVVDAKNGFWHVELDDDSSKLTCFNTPFGRYRWLRMPFGICSAPEEYTRRQEQALEGLRGVKSIADDMLVYGVGETEEEAIIDHNNNLRNLMRRCEEMGLKLNKDKAKLGLQEVPFIGHVISRDGLKPDPEKIIAVVDMPLPTDVKATQRLLGFVNYLSKFLPNLSDLCEPLRKLTVKDVLFEWTESHTQAVNRIKEAVTAYPVLRYFDPNKEVTLQVDASQTGLGAALLQEDQPVAYASRALTDTETRYAQIEKELLAAQFGLERFHTYTYGREVMIQSDHKPLEMIQKKPLHQAPKRLQRMLLRMLTYDYRIYYVPGSKLYLADTLSRAYLPGSSSNSTPAQQEVETVNMLDYVVLQQSVVEQIKAQTQDDDEMQKLQQTIQQGWPEDKSKVQPQLRCYFDMRDELSVADGLVYRGERLVIPAKARRDMLTHLHTAHMGIESTLRRSRESVYWPGMTTQIMDYIARCHVCQQLQNIQQSSAERDIHGA
jgi:predicted aspartyl protease